MPEEFDFERYWLNKFSTCLHERVGKDLKEEIMKESESFSDATIKNEILNWSQKAIEKLESHVDEEKRIDIMTRCACQYPKQDLQEIKKKYEETGDVDLAHKMLQEKFELFLKDSLELNEEYFDFVVSRGWGLAGIKQEGKIIATKIPKSGYFIEYMKESDPEKKKAYYCHCPRVRDALKIAKERLSPTYCYCGAGFYKGIWEEILQKPVKVEVLETVLNGGDLCKIAIYLPEDS
jgi:predicted hydrocarbon binding protein